MAFSPITVHCRALVDAAALELAPADAPGAGSNFTFEIDGLAFDVLTPSTLPEAVLAARREDLGEAFAARCALPPGVVSSVEIQLVGERQRPEVTEYDWAAHLATAFEGTWTSEDGSSGDEAGCPPQERAEALELLRAGAVSLE